MKCCLLFGSCPSTRTFARCFLQTPPCDGSPCIITRPSPPSGWPEDFHLRAAEQCPAHNEPANAGDASRATIWQGNCHVEDQLFYSNITPAQNTIPIQYPVSNSPAKPTGSFKRLYRKRADRGCRLLQALFRRCAFDTALTFYVPNPAEVVGTLSQRLLRRASTFPRHLGLSLLRAMCLLT